MTISFIWDLDGTLIDSYEAILAGIEETFFYYQIPYNKEEVRSYILQYSVQDLLIQVAKQYQLNLSDLNHIRSQSLAEKNAQVDLIPGSRDVLEWAQTAGIQQFVYTHKGDNAFVLLEKLGLKKYFTEILTSQSGFERKPNPKAAHYLIKKYQLDPKQTYYIGDRRLDAAFAKNSGIASLNFLDYPYERHQKISLATDIIKIVENNSQIKDSLS